MRISFDLDNTLICYDPAVPCEPNPIPFFLRRWFPHPMRAGTKQLIKELMGLGWEVWIYTTSYRSARWIRWWFRMYGLGLSSVVNQEMHQSAVGAMLHPPSKYPPAFEIDLHVDDSEGVEREGRRFGFAVVVIDPRDGEWVERVLESVRKISGG